MTGRVGVVAEAEADPANSPVVLESVLQSVGKSATGPR